MINLYTTPQIYDIFYNKDHETPLVNHYREVLKHKSIETIFDCSIGSGNLTFALHDLGYTISGSDLSEDMLSYAAQKAHDRNIQLELHVLDFRNLDTLNNSFDCVMSTGNSLPHVNNEDIRTTLKAMTSLVKPGGYLYFDMRNWDKIQHDQTRFQMYHPQITKRGRTNVVLMKDYKEDQIIFNFLYGFEENNRIIKTEERTVTYYPVKKDFMVSTLESLGYEKFQLFNFVNHGITDFNEMGWYAMICQKI